MAHPKRSSRFAKKIDILRWDGANHVFLALSAGSVAQTMITDGAQETLMRMRGELLCSMDATQAPGRLVSVGIGALVVQAGQGTTVNTVPLTDAEAPWLFYESFSMGYEEMVTDVIDAPGMTTFRKTIDVKAMRILRPSREVQLVVQQATLNGSAAIDLSFNFRALLGS